MDRGKQGIPVGSITASVNRHDSPLLAETLDTVEDLLGTLPEPARVHLDRSYDSDLTRKRLGERGLLGAILEKGKPSPLAATNRWVVERTNSW